MLLVKPRKFPECDCLDAPRQYSWSRRVSFGNMDEEHAPERNERLTAALLEAGKTLGLSVQREYPVPGGRIDVVWLWDGPQLFAVKLPLVGFEIESSWRTRKHLKGDLMNLMDLQPALGVIVLAGDGAKVEATRSFARLMVERHSARVEIWDEAQVEALGTGGPELRDLVEGLPVATTQSEANEVSGKKYAALSNWLLGERRDRIEVSFGEIEEVLGFPLPPSSRKYTEHWSGYKGSAVVRAIKDVGWQACDLDLEAERVVLERASRAVNR
jgi:hypothetical protein